jgi:hypothetical protein
MILLLLLFVLFLVPFRAEAVIGEANSISGSCVTCDFITTSSFTSAASGSLFICDYGVYASGATSLTISDSKPTTYVDVFGGGFSSAYDSTLGGGQWAKENGAGGATHNFTLTITGGTGELSLACREVTDALTSGAFDQFSANNNSNTATTGLTSDSTPTTTQNDEFLAGAAFAMDSGAGAITFTATGGFTESQENCRRRYGRVGKCP